jgi:glycosyltransferase involved in cell wall biosynthesis
MKMKKILVVTCSKDDGKTSMLVKSLKMLENDVTLVINANNSTGLSRAYNKQLVAENLIKHDIVLFVHDDVYIDDLKLKGKLYTAIEDLNYDIVGLAGTRSLQIKRPYLWHLMSERKDWSGAVTHPVDKDRLLTTTFGPWPMRCAVLDGLFLAVNLQRALELGWMFNEKFTFHHYDISSCIDANNKKMKMGTYPIHVTHNSPGLRDMNDKTFVKSADTFKELYGN